MPFCEYCGRPIADNEVCNCRNGEAPVAPPPVNINGQPVYGAPQGAAQKKDSGLWWIWFIIIPVALIFLIVVTMLAAIFVPAYIGYNKKAKTTSVNSYANSLYKGANTALIELDEEDNNIKGRYIISSDRDYNWNVPTECFDIDGFYYKTNSYWNDSDDYEWFVMIENGVVVYSAAAETWSSDMVGTYPIRATVDGPCIYGRYTAESNSYALSEVYNKSADNFSSKDLDDYSSGSYSYF